MAKKGWISQEGVYSLPNIFEQGAVNCCKVRTEEGCGCCFGDEGVIWVGASFTRVKGQRKCYWGCAGTLTLPRCLGREGLSLTALWLGMYFTSNHSGGSMEKSSLQEKMFLNLCKFNGWRFLYACDVINIWNNFYYKMFTWDKLKPLDTLKGEATRITKCIVS